MRTLAWISVGWIGTTLCTAFASRLGPAHVLPDVSILVVVFLALRREPTVVVLAALALGYLVGRAALAPLGLHEMSLVIIAVGVYLAGGSLSGSGGFFFAVTCAAAVMAYHALLFGLTLWQRGAAGFASWGTAILLPSALATFLLAAICYPSMLWMERRLTQDKREGLTWR